MPDDAVAAHAIRAGLLRCALAYHAEAVGVVDVEQCAVAPRDGGKRHEVRGVAGHAVHTIHADEPGRVALSREECIEMIGILEAEAPDSCTARLRDLTAVVDRLVRASVQEHGPRGGQQRDHGHVDVSDRGQYERVLGAQQRRQPLFDLLIQHRATEQARPAGVRSPLVEERGDPLDDLAIQVETEVVARGEIREPAVADADHAAVDLVDDRIHHRM